MCIYTQQERHESIAEEPDGMSKQVSSAKKSGKSSQTEGNTAPLKVAILGFGTVGSSVVRILCERKPHGVELTHIFNRGVARKKVAWVPKSVMWTESFDDVLSSDADVVVELAGGLEAAGEWVRRAILAGKSVVTANKKLIAYRGPALEKLARSTGARLFFGAAVAGGIPVIPGLQLGLSGDELYSIEGILNGTCNYILTKMEEGTEYAVALADAQRAGYAEADPTEDVAGYDARAKLVILARIALHADIAPEEIMCRAITQVKAIDFGYARDLGCTIRQISRADARGAEILATVGPMLVPRESPLAWSRGTENMVVTGGRYGGNTVFSGHGAGGQPTAVAVVSDLLAIAHGGNSMQVKSRKSSASADFRLRHYMRFVVRDRPGIVAEIAGALAEQGINIQAILQKPGYSTDQLPFVVTVEPCSSLALSRALTKMGKMNCMLEPPLDMQILEPEGPA
jgi:homoserine dehydrogenase